MALVATEKSDYVIRYGVNFSHMIEYKLCKLYRDAVKFFESLDREVYQCILIQTRLLYTRRNYNFACNRRI